MEQKKKTSLLDWWDTILSRIGKTEKERLEWAVKLAQESNKMTPGDLANRQLELAAFIGEDRLGISSVDGEIEVPTEQETTEIIEHIKGIIQKAVEREKILIPASTHNGKLFWDERENRFRYWEEPEENWNTRVAHVFKDLLLKYGHLLKKCCAPAVRGREGELCGKLFLASRPDKKYCSLQCQSRTTTRKARMMAIAKKKGLKRKPKTKKPKNQKQKGAE